MDGAQECAFRSLKRTLFWNSTLKLPDFTASFIHQTDVFEASIEAVLLQNENGIKMPVSHVSRILKQR